VRYISHEIRTPLSSGTSHHSTAQRNTLPAFDIEPNFLELHHLIILHSYHAIMSIESSSIIPYYLIQFYGTCYHCTFLSYLILENILSSCSILYTPVITIDGEVKPPESLLRNSFYFFLSSLIFGLSRIKCLPHTLPAPYSII
jgi:hypothetical protein